MRYPIGVNTALLALALAAPYAAAQSYPAKPVRVIVPYAAGGGTDTVARFIAQQITPQWGQQMIVDNRPGAGTNIGTEAVVKAPPDGYTLLMGGAANAINMTLVRKISYDTSKDLAPIVLCTIGANILSVHPSLPAKNVRDVIALAKARPGQLNFGSAGIGSSNHMAGELFKMMAHINIVHVAYKGNTPAMADAVGGHVEMVFSGITAAIPFMKSNRLRAIAVSSKTRFPALPDLPTFHESGRARLRVEYLVRPARAGGNAQADHREGQRRCRQDPRLERHARAADQHGTGGRRRFAGSVRQVRPRRDRALREDHQGRRHPLAVSRRHQPPRSPQPVGAFAAAEARKRAAVFRGAVAQRIPRNLPPEPPKLEVGPGCFTSRKMRA